MTSLRQGKAYAAAFAVYLAAFIPFSAGAQALLFKSGYEAGTTLNPPRDCWSSDPNGCWQDLVGTDATTGSTWPPNIWGGTASFQMIADAPVPVTPETIGAYMFNELRSETGHNGGATQALYSQITQSGCCGSAPQGGGAAQDPYVLFPTTESGDLYISYWLRLQPDLAVRMEAGPQGLGGWHWRALSGWKTAGDYRVVALVRRDPWISNGSLYWELIGDNEANGGLAYKEFWKVRNTTIPVPIGQWLKLEVFWHRSSGSDGRVWMAVNSQVIFDRFGRNMASSNPADPEYGFPDSPRPINRIFPSSVYSSTSYPIYQWVDDLQIWSGFPTECTDPPCAPHQRSAKTV